MPSPNQEPGGPIWIRLAFCPKTWIILTTPIRYRACHPAQFATRALLLSRPLYTLRRLSTCTSLPRTTAPERTPSRKHLRSTSAIELSMETDKLTHWAVPLTQEAPLLGGASCSRRGISLLICAGPMNCELLTMDYDFCFIPTL